MSLRSTAKPGHNGANLSTNDLKHTRHTYAVTSRQARDVIWLEPLRASDPVVVAFEQRDKRHYPSQQFLDHGDTFDAFCTEFLNEKSRRQLIERSQLPTKKTGPAGAVYPELPELSDIFEHVKGTAAPSRLSRRLSRPPPTHILPIPAARARAHPCA